MLKANAAESEKRDLLQELAIMKLLDPHPNVVRLLGCCTKQRKLEILEGTHLLYQIQCLTQEKECGFDSILKLCRFHVSEPIYVILEYISGGSLKNILQRSRSDHNSTNFYGESQSLSSRVVTSFGHQVSYTSTANFFIQ